MTQETTLIADSGSTKTDWAICCESHCVATFKTTGINPFLLSTDEIEAQIRAELLPKLQKNAQTIAVGTIRFYGAGCRDEGSQRIHVALSRLFPQSTITVASDMLCAARALLGDEAGIACILGTGSNSCLYDGRKIVKNVPPLGYILGDEGSGAVLGKRLISDFLKGCLPTDIAEAFRATFPADADTAQVVERVYRSPFPNRYLAHFVPFLKEHESHPAVRHLLETEFSRFFERNVRAYHCQELTVNFVGSIAHHFSVSLQSAGTSCGFTIGTILPAPFMRIEQL